MYCMMTCSAQQPKDYDYFREKFIQGVEEAVCETVIFPLKELAVLVEIEIFRCCWISILLYPRESIVQYQVWALPCT